MFNPRNGFKKHCIRLSRRIFQSPIFPMGARQEGTLHIAAHGNDHIHFRDFRQQLTILAFLHVDAVKLLYEAYSVLVNLGLCLGSGGIAFKYICGKVLSQNLCHLASAGIVDADKGHLWLFSHPLTF